MCTYVRLSVDIARCKVVDGVEGYPMMSHGITDESTAPLIHRLIKEGEQCASGVILSVSVLVKTEERERCAIDRQISAVISTLLL